MLRHHCYNCYNNYCVLGVGEGVGGGVKVCSLGFFPAALFLGLDRLRVLSGPGGSGAVSGS
jgi:hypothetical protein